MTARCRHKWTAITGTYRRNSDGYMSKNKKCARCGITERVTEVPKGEFDMFKRFRKLVRDHPADYFKPTPDYKDM